MAEAPPAEWVGVRSLRGLVGRRGVPSGGRHGRRTLAGCRCTSRCGSPGCLRTPLGPGHGEALVVADRIPEAQEIEGNSFLKAGLLFPLRRVALHLLVALELLWRSLVGSCPSLTLLSASGSVPTRAQLARVGREVKQGGLELQGSSVRSCLCTMGVSACYSGGSYCHSTPSAMMMEAATIAMAAMLWLHHSIPRPLACREESLLREVVVTDMC